MVASVRDLRRGAFGILEPFKGRRAGSPGKQDMIWIPCVGIDSRGHRLGHGGGYYDRFLARHRVPAIGLAFSVQLHPSLPRASLDRPVDAVLTPTRFFN